MLREYRKQAGFSQAHLAGLSRLSVEAVGALERGARRAPYRATIALLAHALDLNPSDRAKLEAAAAGARARAPRSPPPGASADAQSHLPIQATSLVGRDHDVATIVDMLQRSRLVTVTGSGGVGKTRVAIEVASRILSDGRADVRFIDLSQLSDGRLVAENVAAAFGLTLDEAASAADVARACSSAEVLLVLDNCEHLVADVAVLVAAMLQTCPGVTFLAASRERLAVGGEAVYRLPSLELPIEMPADLERARRFDAIELFVQRAMAIDHTFALSDADVDDIWEICRRVDGIPLAIELAAARVSLLGVATLRSRLREGLVLAGGPRNLPARQRTMRATIAWSYDLLDTAERHVLARVALFAGGFTLSAAEYLCDARGIAAGAVADTLSSLVDKSLVNASRSEVSPRFALLDSVRSFALERLNEAGDVAFFSERHAEWVASFADWVDASRAEFTDYRLRTDVDPELENARAALTWALDQRSEAGAVIAGRIVGGLRTIWLTSGRRSECRRWATAVLGIIDERRYPKVVAPLLRALIQMADGAELFALAERATSIFEQIGDRFGVALLQSHVSSMRRRRGFFDEAEAAIERAGAIFAAGDFPRAMPYTVFLHNRAALRLDQGRYDEARADLEEGIGILKSLGDDEPLHWQLLRAEIEFRVGESNVAIGILEDAIERAHRRPKPYARLLQEAYAYLAIYRTLAGQYDSAYVAGREAIRRAMTHADEEVRITTLFAMAILAALRGQVPRAARLSGALDARFDLAASDGTLPSAPLVRQCRAMLAEVVGGALADGEVERLKAEGRLLSIDAAMLEAAQI